MTHRRSVLILALVLSLTALPAVAGHSWGNYHWARTSNPFTLQVHDNLTSNWETYLNDADIDWDKSTILDLNVNWNSPLTSVKRCASATGRVEVCNAKYGQTGWLGVAGISVSGSHITKAYTKVNDTYFETATYNTPAWRRMVMCQEIGHDFGLDHQDETFDNANLGSCMDYTNDPDGGAGGASSNDPSNEHPNSHDYDQIQTIYSHTDSTTTVASVFDTMAKSALRPPTISEVMADAGQWGTPVRYDRQGRPILFVQPTGRNAEGEMEFDLTFVTWAPTDPFDGPGRGK